MPDIELLNCDCMDVMARYPDNYFDLACVDPPYGIGGDSIHAGRKKAGGFSQGTGKLKGRALNSMSTKWDKAPTPEYFSELFRVSKNQIIWGGNYFDLPPYRHPIVWDKCQPWENFSQIELAWTSFNKPASLFKLDNRTGGKIHPTQKPVKLYEWSLTNYAKPGQRILDTHLGSGSSAIAAHYYGVDFVGCELDTDYYEAACKRFKDETAQLDLLRG